MFTSYPNAAKGLKMIFTGQILSIIGMVLTVLGAAMTVASMLAGGSGAVGIVAILGLIAVIAAYVMEIVGLNKASSDDANYRIALGAAIAALVVSILSNVIPSDFISTLLSIVTTLLNFVVVNSVCQTSGNLLHSLGNDTLANRGATVSKIYFICTIVSVVCTVVGTIPFLNDLSSLVSLVAAIVALVGYIMYLTFLSSGSKALA